MPSSKFTAVAELGACHGVKVGLTYRAETMAHKFTDCIGEVFRNSLLEKVREAKYLTIFTDGSTDVSNLEKEMLYVTFMEASAEVGIHFFALNDIEYAQAEGLQDGLFEACSVIGIDITSKLAAFCADRASVNMGKTTGLAALLKDFAPWLVVMHYTMHLSSCSVTLGLNQHHHYKSHGTIFESLIYHNEVALFFHLVHC